MDGIIPALQGTRGFLKKYFVKIFSIIQSLKDSQFMIGEYHWVNLYGIDQIGVVAKHSRQFNLADFLQLFWCERRRLVWQFIPETVTTSQVAKIINF